MKKTVLATLILTLVLLVSSCCGCKTKSKNQVSLENTTWKLIELNDKRIASFNTEPESFQMTLDKDQMKINGVGACNRFFGTFEQTTPGQIDIKSAGMTRMACPNMDLESEFIQTIDKATAYTIDSDMLLLQENGKVIAIFQGVKK